MRRKEFARLLQHPLLQMDGFVLRDALLFKPPLRHVLRGFCFESSAFDQSAFYVDAFVMPLCRPTSYLYFTFGNRVRHAKGGERWKAEMPNLADELGIAMNGVAATFLSRIESLPDFVDYASRLSSTERVLEGIGYALARQSEVTRAIEVFNRLLDRADMTISWHRELAQRVGNLKGMLAESPEEALAKLAASERETVHNLRLDEFGEF